ncbi:unnamed protein product [Leuciscus chuanchicus]
MSVCEEREEVENRTCKMSVCEEREEEASVHTQRAASPVSSCVSMKSNNSMIDPPRLSDGPSPVSSCVSMKSNNSMIDPPRLSDGPSPGSSCVSMKSINSMIDPPRLSDGPSPGSSCVSMKSNNSMIDPPRLSDGPSPVSSCVSMKSNNSKHEPPDLSDGPDVTSDPVVDHGSEVKEFMMTSRLHRYAVDLTLDPNTAHTDLALSEENRKVTCVRESQSYPDHPERFDEWPQVLCGESLTGRCYWEAEWSGDYTGISVSYKGIERKG